MTKSSNQQREARLVERNCPRLNPHLIQHLRKLSLVAGSSQQALMDQSLSGVVYLVLKIHNRKRAVNQQKRRVYSTLEEVPKRLQRQQLVHSSEEPPLRLGHYSVELLQAPAYSVRLERLSSDHLNRPLLKPRTMKMIKRATGRSLHRTMLRRIVMLSLRAKQQRIRTLKPLRNTLVV